MGRTRDSGRVAKRWTWTLARCVSDSVWSPEGKKRVRRVREKRAPAVRGALCWAKGELTPPSLLGGQTTQSNNKLLCCWELQKEEVRVKIKDLNEHIVCCLCAGYFVDATTITECLHTFCKSCIVKYLQTSKYCPMCNIKIHETQPLLNLKLDRVMQDIVYKLVPGLQDSEEKRIREFYQSRGLDRVSQPSGEEPALSNLGLPFSSFDHSKAHYYRYDEQLSLCLERLSSGKDKNKNVLQNKYVRCSVRAEVRHLRRVLCHRLMLNPQHVQLLFDNEVLPDHMTMKQLWLSRWFGKPSPLLLQYSVKEKRR